ncbi:SCO family protein [Novosphingobium umbonatum]|uniref:SCO family protein n=1 Tax=Novosphingobium umbonatum TaxID=1908524 RepID=A0A437N440_9SPHN|nr:SCO family protein [Novosphingobium umbonatum]RVU04678.1 SCO family protein [Novosphingobium umbonatum]
MNQCAMTKPFRSSRPAALFAALAALLILPACSGKPAADQPPLAGAAIGGPFTLVDKTGKEVRWSDFAGHYRIVYFGYTFCPDACPTDVAVAMRGLDLYAKTHAKQADELRPIFITIDPARDTPAVVGQFAAAFSPRLIGLTGSAAQVDVAAKAFAAYYAKGKATAGGYLMDHSRIAYLMGPQGEPITMLTLDKGPQGVAQDLEHWVK